MCIMHSKPWLSKWLWVCIIYSCYCCYCFLLDGLYSMFQNLFVVLCLQSSMFPKIWVFMFSSTWAYCPEMIGMPPWTGGAALELWGHAHGFQACCWTSVCRDSEQAHQKNDRRKCDCNDCIPLCHKTDLFDTWEWVCAKQFLWRPSWKDLENKCNAYHKVHLARTLVTKQQPSTFEDALTSTVCALYSCF